MRTPCPRTWGSDPHDSLRRPAVRSPPRRLAEGQLLRCAGPGARRRPRQPPIDQAAARRARAVEESRHDQHPAPRVGRGRRGRRHPRRSVPPEFANRAIRGGARDVAAGPIGVAVGGRVAVRPPTGRRSPPPSTAIPSSTPPRGPRCRRPRRGPAKANSDPKSHGSTASSPRTAPRSSASRHCRGPTARRTRSSTTGYKVHVAERGCAVPQDAWNDATVGDAPAQRAEFECGGSPGVELIWIVGDTGYVISGEPAVVDLMAETITVK